MLHLHIGATKMIKTVRMPNMILRDISIDRQAIVYRYIYRILVDVYRKQRIQFAFKYY